jgi:hypothetical protein
MTRKRVAPHSRKFDERTILRKQDKFSGGMVKDVEATDLPKNAVANLVNARGNSSSVFGRKGSKLWADFTLPSEASITSLTVTGINVVADSPVFTESMISYMIHIPNVNAKNGIDIAFIRTFVSTTEVTVEKSQTLEDGVYANGVINAPLHASYCDQSTGVHYYLIGTRIYAVIGVSDGAVFNEYFIQGSQMPLSAESAFFRIGKDIVLINPHGQYILSDVNSDEGRYAYKANEDGPTASLSTEEASYATPSSYNYTHTYMRMQGPMNENRNSDDTFIERESVPSAFDVDRQTDLFTLQYPRPIVDALATTYKLNASQYDYVNKFASWVKLSDEEQNPYLLVNYGDDTARVYFDFTAVTTLRDISDEIGRQLYNFNSDIRTVFTNKGTEELFEIYSVDTGDFASSPAFSVDSNSPAEDFDLLNSVDGFLTTASTLRTLEDTVVKTLVYPSTMTDVTHYPMFRSTDIYPKTLDTVDLSDDRIVNNPNILSWIEDVPVCEVVVGNWRQSFNSIGTPKGATGKWSIGSEVRFTTDPDPATIVDIFYSPTAGVDIITVDRAIVGGGGTGEAVFYIGSETLITVTSKTGDQVVCDDTSEMVVGALIYWDDHSYSIIKSIESATEMTTLDTASKGPSYAVINPTSRNFCDSITDVTLKGYLSSWPLQTRFYETFPNVNIATYDDGILLGAERDKTEIHYTTSDDIYHLGVYRTTVQRNDKLMDGVRSLFAVAGVLAILTQNETHYLNPKQSEVVENEFGEYYTKLADPILVQKNIGATHWLKFAPGSKGDIAVLTSEPALRFFNGTEYSKDYSNGAIKITELQRMNEFMVIDYDPIAGINIWGRKDR